MKKSITLFLAGLMTLAACNKQMECNTSFDDGAIRFKSNVLTATKAVDEATESALQQNGFKAAVVVDADNSVLFNTELAYSGGVYAVPGETYYFPAEGTVSAYAAYPAYEEITMDNGSATIDYYHDGGIDFIVAKSTGISKQNEPVNLSFVHTLSQVSFMAKGSDSDVDYKLSMILVTTPSNGTYRFNSNDWDNLENELTFSAFFADEGEAVPVSTSSFQAFGESLTCIPGNARITAVWQCYSKSNGLFLAEYEQSVPINLVQGEHSVIKLELPNSASASEGQILNSISIASWVDSEKMVSISIPDGFVDLRLPSGLLWAKCNLGAENEYEQGLYFKWGETVGHTSSELSHFDGNYVETFADAVTADYGGLFRMPTQADFAELFDFAALSEATINGVNGIKFSRANDESVYIFFPVTGKIAEGQLADNTTMGYYWTGKGAQRHETNNYFVTAYGFNFHSSVSEGLPEVTPQSALYGYAIRPVY